MGSPVDSPEQQRPCHQEAELSQQDTAASREKSANLLTKGAV
jgi:hypothetical protein